VNFYLFISSVFPVVVVNIISRHDILHSDTFRSFTTRVLPKSKIPRAARLVTLGSPQPGLPSPDMCYLHHPNDVDYVRIMLIPRN